MNGRIGLSRTAEAAGGVQEEGRSVTRSPVYRMLVDERDKVRRCAQKRNFLMALTLVLFVLVVSSLMAAPGPVALQPSAGAVSVTR
jgi:hypothetical protein